MKNPNPVNLQTPEQRGLDAEPIGYCVWISPTKLAACAKSAKGAFPVYTGPAAPSEFCGCMAGPNDPDPTCKVCSGSGDGQPLAFAAKKYVSEGGFEHSGGIIEAAFEAGANWAIRAQTYRDWLNHDGDMSFIEYVSKLRGRAISYATPERSA